MKKNLTLILTFAALIVAISMQAQTKFYVYNTDGSTIEFLISNVDSISFTEPVEITSVTDCQGNSYPVVKIGQQYWMAENLKCTKYDTQSEKAGQTLTTSESATIAPYYTDGRQTITEYSENLSEVQRNKLGLLYNWAAATGLTEQEAIDQLTDFETKRQGICPNGYHIPTVAEWGVLAEVCGGSEVAGKKLKATSGWYEDLNGTDDYGFAGLPAGNAIANDVDYVGFNTDFWSSTAYDEDEVYIRVCSYAFDRFDRDIGGKYKGKSVRCLRDN